MDDNKLMTPSEVAEAFYVSVHTVTLWARTGKLRSIRTPGGQRRYFREDIEAILKGTS